MSILKVNSIEPASAGSEDFALARVWSSQFGDGNSPLDDFNVSSYTDLGTDVKISFNNTFSNTYYAAVINTHRRAPLGTLARFGMCANGTTSDITCACFTDGGATSALEMSLVIFGDLA